MAEVYLAKHPRLPRHDVLKVLAENLTADAEFRERFNREADLAATLWHPHIVGLHDRGEFLGQLWISMDYVDGTDAARLVKEHYPDGMPLPDVCAIVDAVADALDYAHDRGLLHRDVKPANILLTNPDGEERRILLADFGVARHLADVSGLTATNVAVGTVSYAAPEQLMGSSIDGRADQYALAATAFHLLTGSPPYEQSNPIAVISQHLHAAPPKLSDHRPDLAYLDGVFCKALAKEPEARFDRCREFTVAFDRMVHGGANRDRGARYSNLAAILRQRGSESAQPNRRRSLKARTAIAVSGAVLVTVATTWSAVHVVHGNVHVVRGTRLELKTAHQPRRDATTLALPRPAASATAVPSSPSLPRLNGAYRLDFDRTKWTGKSVPLGHTGVQSSWWAFRSWCTATGCVATGTGLDDGNHQAANIALGGQTDVLRFIDGYWQGEPERVRVGCHVPDRLGTSSTQLGTSSTQSEMIVWSLAPRADGTLRGMQTETVHSNECGAQGVVHRIPMVATRIGDVPPNVTVADPATVSGAPAAPAAIPSASVLAGSCRDIGKLGYDLTTNQEVVCEGDRWDKAPVTAGVHTAGASCAQPDMPVFAMSASDDGYLIECDPLTRVWTRHAG